MFCMKKKTENSTITANIYLLPALRLPALLRLHSSAIRLTVLSLRNAFDNALANNGGRILLRRPHHSFPYSSRYLGRYSRSKLMA